MSEDDAPPLVGTQWVLRSIERENDTVTFPTSGDSLRGLLFRKNNDVLIIDSEKRARGEYRIVNGVVQIIHDGFCLEPETPFPYYCASIFTPLPDSIFLEGSRLIIRKSGSSQYAGDYVHVEGRLPSELLY